MNLFGIAFGNIRRRKAKSIFITLSLVIGIATVIAMMSIIGAMKDELGDRIDEFGANALIMPRSDLVDSDFELSQDIIYEVGKLTMADIPLIYTSEVSEYINIVSPKLIGAVDTVSGKALMVGIEPEAEFGQKPWLSLDQGISGSEELSFINLPDDGVIVGSSAARAFNVGISDTIQINDQSFQVTGILKETGGEEDGLIYGQLAAIQTLLDKPGDLTLIEISAYCNACPIEEVAAGLEMVLPESRVIPLRRAALIREETIGGFSVFGYSLAGIVLLIAVLVLIRTMVSSIHDRTREIGIFRAIGFRRIHVAGIIFIESGLVSLAGGLVGFGLGSVAASIAGPSLAGLKGSVSYQPELLLPAILLSVTVAIIASAYPALKAARLNPAEALRFI